MTFAANLAALARRVIGTAANNLVALDGSGKLPAVDGNQLTNLSVFGNGQTWKDTTALRSFGTVYQNTSNKPILFSCWQATANGSPGSVEIKVGASNPPSVTVAFMSTTSSATQRATVQAVVPAGHYYMMTGSGLAPSSAELSNA